jgi:hypothetical protein
LHVRLDGRVKPGHDAVESTKTYSNIA